MSLYSRCIGPLNFLSVRLVGSIVRIVAFDPNANLRVRIHGRGDIRELVEVERLEFQVLSRLRLRRARARIAHFSHLVMSRFALLQPNVASAIYTDWHP